MSDYMFMLESHLTPDQYRVVNEVQNCAAAVNLNVFLTGGAMRDMLGGFPIRDLDFTVEGNALKLAKSVAAKTGAEIVAINEHKKAAELRFEGGISVEIAMARQERYSKPGARPNIQPATIHEDLRGRDFTINSIALSLNPASRGLLLDPNNGMGDIEHKEIRAVSNYTLYDDPARIVRLIRLKGRLGYAIAERTQSQYENAREAQLETKIPPEALGEELRSIADDVNAGEILKLLEDEKLLPLFSPALAGPKLNLSGFAKLQKARQLVPFSVEFPIVNIGLFLSVLTEKLNPKERSALVKNTAITKADISAWQKLEPAAKKLEKGLKSPALQRASRLYELLVHTPGEQILFLLVKSNERLVQDRIRNYLQKYLPASLEVTDKDVAAKGVEPGTPKFKKLKAEMIATRLDARPKKIVPPPEPVPAPGPPGRGPRGSQFVAQRPGG
jgi:tRNA nucleotidyltransferase (CCA-adding enzyme)